MHIKTLAVMAAAVNTAFAGSAYVYNLCDFPVYNWPTDTTRNPKEPIVIAPGASWSEEYKTPLIGGVSIKLQTEKVLTQNKLLQYEYTVGGSLIFYDGSHVDCRGDYCPFMKYGTYIDTSIPSCPTPVCLPGVFPCHDFYTEFNDDWATKGCSVSADIRLYLCSTDGKTSTTGSTGSAGGAAPAVSSAASQATPSAKKWEMEKVVAPTTIKKVAVTPRAVHDHARRHHHH